MSGHSLTIYRVCLASIFVLVESIGYRPAPKDIPHDYALNGSWGGVEVNMAVFASTTTPPPLKKLLIALAYINILGCLPMLKPVFRKVLFSSSSHTNNYGRCDDVQLPHFEDSGVDVGS